MGKIDCSKTLNYVKELERMCYYYVHRKENSCSLDCPLGQINCTYTAEITQQHIDLLQKWSDEHPQQTIADKFFEIFPNAKKMENGLPLYCPHYLGWGEYEKCPKGQGIDISCADCWNRPYSEVEK